MVIVICCYVVVNFPPSSSQHAQVFLLFDSCERDIHRTTSLTLSLQCLIQIESHSQSSRLVLLSKTFSSRSCFKFRGSNDDRNGIYSSPTKIIADAILFGYPLRSALAKKYTHVTRDGTICAKIAHLAILMEPTPLLEMVLFAVSYPDYGS